MKSIYIATFSTLLPFFAMGANKCTQQKQAEFEQRLAAGVQHVTQTYLQQADSQVVAKAFANIAIAEQQLIVWGCYSDADPRLLLRHIRIHNQMDVYPAAFQTISHNLKTQLGIDLLSPAALFNTTIHLKHKGNTYEQ